MCSFLNCNRCNMLLCIRSPASPRIKGYVRLWLNLIGYEFNSGCVYLQWFFGLLALPCRMHANSKLDLRQQRILLNPENDKLRCPKSGSMSPIEPSFFSGKGLGPRKGLGAIEVFPKAPLSTATLLKGGGNTPKWPKMAKKSTFLENSKIIDFFDPQCHR